MRYAERIQYAVICERCGRQGPWALSQKAARIWAEAAGWKFPDALCPDCQEQEQEQKQEDPNAL